MLRIIISVSIIGLTGIACKQRDSRLKAGGMEGSEEIYEPVSIFDIPVPSLFQMRDGTSTDMCIVPGNNKLITKPCDGKAHWELLYRDPNQRETVRVRHTVAPLCLGAGTNASVQYSLSADLVGGKELDCNNAKYDIRAHSGGFNSKEGRAIVGANFYKAIEPLKCQESEEDKGTKDNCRGSDLLIRQRTKEVFYAQPFLMPNRYLEKTTYSSNYIFPGFRKWLSKIEVCTTGLGTDAVSGIRMYFIDTGNATVENVGVCTVPSASIVLGDAEGKGPPKNIDIKTLKPAGGSPSKYKFLTGITALHTADGILKGLRVIDQYNNKLDLLGSAATSTQFPDISFDKNFLESPLPFPDPNQNVIFGVYSSWTEGRVRDPIAGKDVNVTAIKDLGLIGGSLKSYVANWNGNPTVNADTGAETYVHQRRKAYSYRGQEVEYDTQNGYFDSFTGVGSVQRHYIKRIIFGSGGGSYSERKVIGHNHRAFANDVIGLRIHAVYNLISEENQKKADYDFGLVRFEGNYGSRIRNLDQFEYICGVSIKGPPDSFEQCEKNCYTNAVDVHKFIFKEKKGVAAIKLSICNLLNSKKEEINWDTSLPKTGQKTDPTVNWMPVEAYRQRTKYTEYKDIVDAKGADLAVIGFYGNQFELGEPGVPGEKGIVNLGVWTTSPGCLFHQTDLNDEQVAAIGAQAKVKIESGKTVCGK